jgi:hypothetical protein
MDDFVWLEKPLHKNNFPKNFFEDNEGVLETLKLSFDGSIVAVKRDLVEKEFEAQQVDMMRLGYKPWPEKVRVESVESFYNYLALWVEM